MASNECNSTADCVIVGNKLPRVCYEQVSFSERENFCDCSNWYGWRGERCDQPSPHLWYSISLLIFLTCWAFFVMFLSSRTIYFHIRFSLRKGKDLDPVFFTGLLVFAGAMFLSIYTLINLPALFDSSRFELTLYRSISPGDIEDITAKGGRAATYCFISMGTVYFIVSTQIILSWYRVVEKTQNFLPMIFKVPPEKVKFYIKLWIFVVSLITSLLLITDFMFGATVVMILAGIMVVFLYLVGGRSLIKVLTRFHGETNAPSQAVFSMVIFSCKVNGVLVTTGVILVAVIDLTYFKIEQSLKPGSFNPNTILRDLVISCVLALLTFDSWYVHTVSRNILKLDRSYKWIPGLPAHSTQNKDSPAQVSGHLLNTSGNLSEPQFHKSKAAT